ncbi:MAG TPA: Asp-tRNA(Asn)/Glu-tRNA(Gln) amidotransferase subunit GatB [Polyangia bacterium]
MSAPRFEAVIGLEVHVQLQTRTKAFTSASASFGAAPNTHTDPYSLALPGTLPVLSRAAVDAALRMGLACACEITRHGRFARKHYFYPDSPKGYQISQLDEPLCRGGRVEFVLDGAARRVRLNRIHMEEDAGKSMHAHDAPISLVDYNRAGVPLVEIVSEPDLRSAAEAGAYLRAVRQLVRWLGISDGNMEEGSLRCDANVSVRPAGETKLGTKAELKNMNSFKHVEAAIDYEIARQSDLVARGERVTQETRLWNADKGTSHAMRSKEQAHDYRYFPEPDLPPLVVDEAWIARVRGELPELPLARLARFESLGLSAYDAGVLTSDRAIADYFDAIVKLGAPPKKVANWIMIDLAVRVPPAHLAELIALVDAGTISGKIAKDVYEKMRAPGIQSQRAPRAIVEAEGLTQVTDAGAIEAACRAVVDANPKQVAQYQGGNPKILGFFVGNVMKATQGKANPEMVNEILKRLLS